MAANLKISAARRSAGMDSIFDAANGGTIEIYTGAQPATPETAIGAQTKLATLTFNATAFGAAASGVKTANAITSGVAVATGTAAWYRAKNSGGTAIFDGSVGTSSADLVLDSVAIQSGAVVSASSMVMTAGNA